MSANFSKDFRAGRDSRSLDHDFYTAAAWKADMPYIRATQMPGAIEAVRRDACRNARKAGVGVATGLLYNKKLTHPADGECGRH